MRSASSPCLASTRRRPQVTRDRMYLDTMQQVFTNVSKVMVDSRNGSNLLYLPLDKLMQQGNGSVTVSQPQPAAPALQILPRPKTYAPRRPAHARPRKPLSRDGDPNHEPFHQPHRRRPRRPAGRQLDAFHC